MAEVAPARGDPPPQQAQGGGVTSMIIRMGVMYLLMSLLRGNGKPKDTSTLYTCKFTKGEAVDMQVYMSTEAESLGALIWEENEIPLAGWSAPFHKSINFTEDALSPIIEHNATAWLTTVFSRSTPTADFMSSDVSDGNEVEAVPAAPIKSADSFHVQTKLVMHRPPPKVKIGKFLLSEKLPPTPEPSALDSTVRDPAAMLVEQTAEEVSEEAAKPWIPYWKPNITIAVVDDFAAHAHDKMPPYFVELAQLDHPRRSYHPIVTLSEFWLLKDYMVPLNSSVHSVMLHLELSTLSPLWLQMQMAMQQSFEMQSKGGMMQDGESDELKRVFLEGNPYLLGLTTVVSLLHSVFDMLAFKNDIGFWKNNKSMEGLSARTIIINALCQLVIFLYLLDNKTSYVVLFSSGIGTLIEFWKVTKAMDVKFEWTPQGLPSIKFQDRGSYVTSKTKQYDDEAMKYLSWVLFPLIICYSGYSLMYSEHKSWYSWGLGSLVGCVYTFGFVLMCPQLYLNYKLKSVAHLPWRQMTYKFLNTIIDDLFAFVIKMPTLHRLSVFRDDAVFLILIYQRWIYPVDKKRVNEFGFSDEAPAPDPAQIGSAPEDGVVTSEHADSTAAVQSTGRKDATIKGVATADTAAIQDDSTSKGKAKAT